MKTAINFLVEWTDNVNWKTHLLNKVLQNEDINIETLTNEIIDIFDKNKLVIPIVSLPQKSEQNRLYINEIKTPININALCSEASCNLGKNLNVFYGENGSGKSSYVKIFRKLADNFYTNENNLSIKSNIYNKTKTSSEQNITICYSYDGNESCIECVDINARHNELSQINVFDSSSITPLLNNDLTFSVLPQGLNYFSQLTDIIDSVKAKIQELVNNNQTEQSEIFTDTSFSIIIEDITTITSTVSNIKKLESFLSANYKLADDVDSKIVCIESKIIEYQSTNPIDLIKILGAQKRKLESIKNGFNELSNKVNLENISLINEFVKRYDELLEKEKKYNEDFSSRVQHITTVNTEWVTFINAAQEYYKSIGVDLPELSSKCIFCGQELSSEHIDLIQSCFNHIDSETSKAKKIIDKKIQSFNLPEIAVTFSNEDEFLFNVDKKAFIGEVKAIISLIEKNEPIFKRSIENKQEVKEECCINFEDIISRIRIEINDIDVRLISLGKTNSEVTEIIANITEEKNVHLRCKKIHQSEDLFKKWYEYKVIIDSLNKIKSKFSTASLTTKSKDAFKEIVAGEYSTTFNDYCNNLGVPHVSIKLNPHKGQTKRNKYLVKEDIKVTEIMSEGEQKAIALAEFSTDLKIRNNHCTTIFDDPVTSFDYKRAEKIADLIYEISKERQVIVFTHNIMFYYYLYSCCSEKNLENKFFKIDEFDRDNKGLISQSFEGRLENLKGITGKIKNASQKIASKSCLGDELEQTLKATYSDIRTWCELIVEEGFLRNIIRRYEPNIMFNPISKITTEFVGYIPKVSDLFDKSCRYMLGHSQPKETQNVKATREEFNDDYGFILELSNKYK